MKKSCGVSTPNIVIRRVAWYQKMKEQAHRMIIVDVICDIRAKMECTPPYTGQFISCMNAIHISYGTNLPVRSPTNVDAKHALMLPI